VDQSSPDFIRGTREEWLSITFFQILDIWSHSGDVRDQSRKLSKIALNFGRFLLSQILGGRPFKSYTHVMIPVSRHVVWKMFCGDTPTSPEVIVANTLNFKTNFKFSRLKFFWGGPPFHFGCALSRLGQSLARVKFSGRSTPYWLKYSLPKKSTWVAQF